MGTTKNLIREWETEAGKEVFGNEGTDDFREEQLSITVEMT